MIQWLRLLEVCETARRIFKDSLAQYLIIIGGITILDEIGISAFGGDNFLIVGLITLTIAVQDVYDIWKAKKRDARPANSRFDCRVKHGYFSCQRLNPEIPIFVLFGPVVQGIE